MSQTVVIHAANGKPIPHGRDRFYVRVGQNIRARRKQKRLTQGLVGRAAGYSIQTISAIERSEKRPDAFKLAVIAAALGVGLDELIGIPR
jgi:transcriptional regulator with XRE-family HTH domain